MKCKTLRIWPLGFAGERGGQGVKWIKSRNGFTRNGSLFLISEVNVGCLFEVLGLMIQRGYFLEVYQGSL